MKLFLSTLSVAGLAGLAVSTLASVSAHATAPAVRAGSEHYGVDNTHSTVLFRTRHIGISEAYGRFDRISDKSQVVYDEGEPSKSSILVVIEAESVNTNAPDRDKHLRSADFFNSKEFPEIVFESKKISGKPDALTVEGELTFHGVTRPVKAKAHVVGSGDTMFQDHRTGFVAELSLDMADYGLEFVKKTPGAVGPEVGLTISLECVRK